MRSEACFWNRAAQLRFPAQPSCTRCISQALKTRDSGSVTGRDNRLIPRSWLFFFFFLFFRFSFPFLDGNEEKPNLTLDYFLVKLDASCSASCH